MIEYPYPATILEEVDVRDLGADEPIVGTFRPGDLITVYNEGAKTASVTDGYSVNGIIDRKKDGRDTYTPQKRP